MGRSRVRPATDNEPVIRDVDASLEGWLGGLVPDVRISFEPPVAPTRASGAKGKDGARPAVTLSVLLYDVREDPDGSLSGWDEVRDQRGVVVGRTPPPKRYRLTYLLVATAADPLAEHEVLGRVLAGAARDEVVPTGHLAGEMVHAEHDMLVRCAPATGTADPQHLWSTWDCPARAALELSVLVPMPMALLVAVPPPPAHLDLHTARRDRAEPAVEPVRPRPTSTVHEH